MVALGDTVSMGAPSPVLTTHTRSRGELLNLARIKYLGHLRIPSPIRTVIQRIPKITPKKNEGEKTTFETNEQKSLILSFILSDTLDAQTQGSILMKNVNRPLTTTVATSRNVQEGKDDKAAVVAFKSEVLEREEVASVSFMGEEEVTFNSSVKSAGPNYKPSHRNQSYSKDFDTSTQPGIPLEQTPHWQKLIKMPPDTFQLMTQSAENKTTGQGTHGSAGYMITSQ